MLSLPLGEYIPQLLDSALVLSASGKPKLGIYYQRLLLSIFAETLTKSDKPLCIKIHSPECQALDQTFHGKCVS